MLTGQYAQLKVTFEKPWVAVSRWVGETATASSRTQPGMILS